MATSRSNKERYSYVLHSTEHGNRHQGQDNIHVTGDEYGESVSDFNRYIASIGWFGMEHFENKNEKKQYFEIEV